MARLKALEPKITAFCATLCRDVDHVEAGEVMHITTVKAWNKRETFQENAEESFIAWLTAIAYNVFIDECRKSKIKTGREVISVGETDILDTVANSAASPYDDVEKSITLQQLSDVICSRLKLKRPHWQLFVMFYGLDFSDEDAAAEFTRLYPKWTPPMTVANVRQIRRRLKALKLKNGNHPALEKIALEFEIVV